MKTNKSNSLLFDVTIPLIISIGIFVVCYFFAYRLMIQVNGPINGLSFSTNSTTLIVYVVTNFLMASYFYGVLDTFYRKGLIRAIIAFILIPVTAVYGVVVFLSRLVKQCILFIKYLRNNERMLN